MMTCQWVSQMVVIGHMVCHVTCCTRTPLDGDQTPPTAADVATVSVCKLYCNSKLDFSLQYKSSLFLEQHNYKADKIATDTNIAIVKPPPLPAAKLYTVALSFCLFGCCHHVLLQAAGAYCIGQSGCTGLLRMLGNVSLNSAADHSPRCSSVYSVFVLY